MLNEVLRSVEYPTAFLSILTPNAQELEGVLVTSMRKNTNVTFVVRDAEGSFATLHLHTQRKYRASGMSSRNEKSWWLVWKMKFFWREDQKLAIADG